MAQEVHSIPVDSADVRVSDQIITVDNTDSVRLRSSTSLLNYINSNITTLQRPFSNTSGSIATWAEGDDVSLIPVDKIPNLPTTQITGFNTAVDARVGTNVVRTIGNQTIDGVKNFTDLRSNGSQLFTTQFLSNTTTGVTLTGDFTSTGDVTLGASTVPIESFLQSIEDAGGRQTAPISWESTVPFPTGTVGQNELGIVATGSNFADVIGFRLNTIQSSITLPAGAGNFYLIYVDNSNYILAELATESSIGTLYATFVEATDGSFSNGQEISIYSSVNGINVRDFLNFFQTNTPLDTPYTIPSGLGRTITDGDGDTERIVGGAITFRSFPEFQFLMNTVTTGPLSARVTTGDFNPGDVVRIRIYEDDVDQATATPILDVRKQIVLIDSGNFIGLGTGGNAASVFTQAEVDSLITHAVEESTTTPFSGGDEVPVYYFADDQIRIDRSSQVEAESLLNPANITVDGRVETTELQADSQVLFNGLPTTDPNVPNQLYTQTASQLGITGGSASQKFVLIS